jgi:hypothetical protein
VNAIKTRRTQRGNPNPKTDHLPKGRQKGVQNKITRSVKEAFIAAFEEMGGVEHLVSWAKANPTQFYRCYVAIAPKTIVGEGEDGSIKIRVIVEEAGASTA